MLCAHFDYATACSVYTYVGGSSRKKQAKYNPLEENRRFSTLNKNEFIHKMRLCVRVNKQLPFLLVLMPKIQAKSHIGVEGTADYFALLLA